MPRIIIDIDDDVWADAWSDWTESLPDGIAWPAASGNLNAFSYVVRARLSEALGIKTERPILLAEYTDDRTDDDDTDDDEGM